MHNSNLDKEKHTLNTQVWRTILKEFSAFKLDAGLLLLFSSGSGVSSIGVPMLTRSIIDSITGENYQYPLPALIFAAVCLILFITLTTSLFIYFAGRLENKIAFSLRERSFKKLQSLSLSFYDTNAVGSLIARITSDIPRLSETLAWGLVDPIWGVFILIATLTVMSTLSIKLMLIAVLMLPVLVIAMYFLQKPILTVQRKVRKINSELTAAYNESIQGAKTTKALVRESLNAEEFYGKAERMRETSIRAIWYSAALMPIVQIISGTVITISLLVGGADVLKGVLSIGTLIAFFSMITTLIMPISMVFELAAELFTAQASAERIYSLLQTESAIQDTETVVKTYGTLTAPTGEKHAEFLGNIIFENVSFSYKENEQVLYNFNLSVRAGETIALVGATGAGKTTVVNLCCRFYEPTEGTILFDGTDYLQLPQSYIHENLGFVLQDPYLFSGSIRENIAYGNFSATEEDIIAAAKAVEAHPFITAFTDGYDTQVGEGGGLLSTGQKQLISFARILVRNPRLFILDEATSSIDVETERKIQHALAAIVTGRTSFIIAHRLSTIKNADRIIVLENGRILEIGNHAELLQKGGRYYELHQNRFADE